MSDLSIVRLLMKKENLDKYGELVYNNKILKQEQDIYKILLSINKYYEEYKHHIYISLDELETYFFTQYPSQKTNATFRLIFDRLRSLEVSDSLAADIILQSIEKETAAEILEMLLPVINGDGKNALVQIPDLVERFKTRAKLIDEEANPFVQANLEDLLSLINKEGGLSWGLEHLDTNIRALPGCTLGHIFARVETGKTTFIANAVANFLPQLTGNQSILWASNEENEKFIKLRGYQAILQMSSDELYARIQAGERDQLEEQYAALGGNRLHTYYDTCASVESIRTVLEKLEEPRILIVDIADHVTFRGDSDLAGPARLGTLYRKFRSMASAYGMDILTVGQASAECDGRKVLHMDHMHNSKTDKPGALDYAIGIGKTYEESEKERRWLTICKNKIGCTTKETDVVRIDTLRGRMYDV